MSSQPDDPTQVDARRAGPTRRAVVTAVAWSAPIVVAVGSTPWALASGDTNEAAAVYTSGLSTNNPNSGELEMNYAQVQYAPGRWGLQGQDFPTSVTFTWVVSVTDAAGKLITTFTSKAYTLSAYGNTQLNAQYVSGLTVGETYTVTSSIENVVYTPNPVKGVTFKTENSSTVVQQEITH